MPTSPVKPQTDEKQVTKRSKQALSWILDLVPDRILYLSRTSITPRQQSGPSGNAFTHSFRSLPVRYDARKCPCHGHAQLLQLERLCRGSRFWKAARRGVFMLGVGPFGKLICKMQRVSSSRLSKL